MSSINHVTVRQTSNGFTVDHPPENGGSDRVVSSFESFVSMSHYLGQVFITPKKFHQGKVWMDAVSPAPEQSEEQMRDELGELRRFKDRAIKRDEEKQKQIDGLIASLDRSRDRETARDIDVSELRQELETAHNVNDAMHKRLNKRIKKSARRKA